MNNEQKVASTKPDRLLVCLFSDPNFLAVNILENLLSSNCIVNIISDYESEWFQRTGHIADKSRYFVTKSRDYKKITNFSHAIFCGGFLKKSKAFSDFKIFITNKNFGAAKTLAVFPFENFSYKTSSNVSIGKNAGIVYVGDLLGARIDLSSDLLMPKLITEMVEKRTLTMGIGELFYPLLVSEASRTISKWLLSFGPYGKEIFLVGPQVTTSDFWKENIGSFPDLKIIYDTDLDTRIVPKGYELKRVNANLPGLLSDTYRWIINTKFVSKQEKPVQKEKKVRKIKLPRYKKNRFRRLRILRPFLLPIFLILFFPLITCLFSSGFLYWAYHDFLNDKIQSSQKKALMAKTVFVIGKHESEVLGYVPLLGKLYKEASFVSYIGENVSDAFAVTSPLAKTSKDLLNNVLGNGVYDITGPSREIKSGLEYLYQQLSLVQIATEDGAKNNVLAARQVLNLVDFNALKNLTQQGVVLTSGLPELLGNKDTKNYLVLFQNNMELRPTGGFIGSYGIATFGGGRLNGLTVNDIYSADGQLKGHIEPPEPIKKYLGEGNWWFRDSNWDPDFPTSAQRAEWFLQKEMSQKVDGVVAIDLTPIKNILIYTGPIFLPDYNLTISAENLYEKTQEEAQANFFPGSRKKASFLTALSRVLINEISNMESSERIGVLKSIYKGFEERNIQVYLHNEDLQKAIGKLDWDGRLPIYSCGNDCYSDFFGDVEANVGVNKSNYFISRKLSFSAKVIGRTIRRDLDIQLQNTANNYLGPSGQYQVYTRVLVPLDSHFVSADLAHGQSSESVALEVTQEDARQEAGVYIELNPGETKNLRLRWESEIAGDKPLKSYGLFVRKQAGTTNDVLNLKIGTPAAPNFTLPQFSLTKSGTSTYNTILSRDFYARLSWK